VALAWLLAGCGGSRPAGAVAAPAGSGGRVQVVSTVDAGARTVDRLPGTPWVVSFDVHLLPGSRIAIDLGYGGAPLHLSAADGGLRVAIPGQGSSLLTRPHGWLGHGWWHAEATNTRLAIDGRTLPVAPSSATTLAVSAEAGRPRMNALIATASADTGLLLLHRLVELHARIPARHFPVGATVGDHIVYGSTYWTSGFWPGALWEAAAIAPGGGLFSHWALTSTLKHFGQERADTHDVGFMYGESSLAAWRALCHGRLRTSPGTCAHLRGSVLSAAGELLSLAATNPGAGTIPTNATSPAGDTIIDSMMNIAILPWASQVTGNPAYTRLALHHAQVVARVLVRPNGSTAHAVNFDRRTGRVLSIGTHQGLSDTSTWSRGQGWAVYGFAQAALALRNRALLRVALRAATYVAGHLPSTGVPRWDYDAPAGAPVDVSAGVITASGMFHLAQACRALGSCQDPGRWVTLGRRMLAGAMAYARPQPPLGLLGSQILNERGRGCWCDGGELIFGLTYGLEGLRLEVTAR
jgi:unsaturated chondroitin disaccharide hydrolase